VKKKKKKKKKKKEGRPRSGPPFAFFTVDAGVRFI
jgi:hypothetical protein